MDTNRLTCIAALHNPRRVEWEHLTGVLGLPILALLLETTWLSGNSPPLFVYDDSYITLGLARNLTLTGVAIVDGTTAWYGMTSPLHVFLVALMFRVFGSVELSAVFVGMVSTAFLVVAVYFWALRVSHEKHAALAASFLTASSGWIAFDALSGLETVTYMLMSVLVLLSLQASNPYLVGVLAGLTIWTRPEGWFLLVAASLSQLVKLARADGSRLVSRSLKLVGIQVLVTVGVVTPLLILNYAHTGLIAPATALTKACFFAEITMSLATKTHFFLDALQSWYVTLMFATVVFLLFAVFARHSLDRCVLYCYPLLFYGFYFLVFPGGLGHYWCRYQHIFLPIVYLFVAEGAIVLLSVLRQHWRVISPIVVVGTILVCQGHTLADVYPRYTGSAESIRQVNMELAQWIDMNTAVGDVIAVHDIGTVTYFLEQRKVLDLVGLVNPDMDIIYREGLRPISFEDRKTAEYLRNMGVAYVVMFYDWRRFLNVDPETIPGCTLVHETLPIYGSQARYRVYRMEWRT